MKPFSDYLAQLPVVERTAIEDGARWKLAMIRLRQTRVAAGITQRGREISQMRLVRLSTSG